ncbi:MAG: hypothetical protein LVT47_02385 [Cyanobacteria bacterium LVE1205-1]|jgi:hypothetical protein
MLLTPSPEFISLCRSQVILAQGLGASFSIVYLAKDLVNGGDTELIPLIVHPESAVEWSVTHPWIPPTYLPLSSVPFPLPRPPIHYREVPLSPSKGQWIQFYPPLPGTGNSQ